MAADIKKLNLRADALFSSSERQNNEALWEELAEFMLNNQSGQFKANSATATDISGLNSTSPGSKRTRRLFDSTALQATQDLAAAFQGTLTNPATIWSKIRFKDEELNNDEDAVNWLENQNKLIHNSFNESNFNTEIGKAYQSFVTLANMLLLFEEDEDGGFRFTSLHLAKVAWAEDKHGLVDSIFRKFTLTAGQAVDRWGSDCHPEILEAAEKRPDAEFSFLHCITPRDKKEVKLNSVGRASGDKRPIASVYIDTSHNIIVEETGYYEMPGLVARWGTMPGETYGRGPGHLALPDTRTLNRLKQRGLEAIDLQVRPPLFANQRDVLGQLDLRPGAVSVVKDHNGIREFVSQARGDILQFSVEELRASIKSIFFLDKLLLPPRNETGEMTAYEISQRIEQMQRVLGPTLSRVNSELLNPLIIRAFKILIRNGQTGPIPDILKERGIDIEIVFVNQLARAQQIQDVTNIQQWVQSVGVLAQLDPSIVDNINMDGVARHTAKILGVPEVAVQNQDVVEAIRQQRQQQMQAQQALEAGVQMADIQSKTSVDEPQQ